MRYEVDPALLDHFSTKAKDYVQEMRDVIALLDGKLRQAAESTRDGAVAGASQDVRDILEQILRSVDELEEDTVRTVDQKYVKYTTNRPSMKF